MSVMERIMTIGIIVICTVFTRAIAFIVFPSGKETPSYITYLGKVLPASALGMLVIYCMKDYNLLVGTHAIPELLSIGVVCGLHLWKKNMFLSIVGGTVVYMLMVNI